MTNPFKSISLNRKLIHENGFYGFEAFRIFWDLYYCRRTFHCTKQEYFRYKFYNFKNRYRKYFLLRYHQRVSYGLVDRGSYVIYGKERQYTLFADKIKRDWMYVTPDNISEVEGFIRKHGKVIFKPIHGSQGKGIFAFSAEEIEDQFVHKCVAIVNDEYICEQYVIQHPKMSEINPNSVNTIRAITLFDGQNVKAISAGLRTGSEESVCDNMSIGGVGAAIDIDTGIITTTGVNYEGERFVYHPVSGTKIIGFEIPYWKEVLEMITECARRVSKAAIVGWDVAVTETGPCLIEANNRPAGKLCQIATERPQGEEMIEYINNNWKKYHENITKEFKKRMNRWL